MSQLTEKTAGTGAGSNTDRSEAESEKSVTTEKIKVPTVAKPKMRLDENGKIVIDKMSLYQTFQNERKVLANSRFFVSYRNRCVKPSKYSSYLRGNYRRL